MRHRGHGEGSIYERSDGRWVANLTIQTGKRKYFYGTTRKEVQEKLRKAQRELELGKLATGPQQTLKNFLEYWLRIRKPAIKQSTYVSYRECIKNHIIPGLGHIQLQKLTGDQIQGFYTEEQGKVSANVVRLLHTILRIALADAVKWKRLSTNPCSDVEPPRHQKHQIEVLTIEQAKKLLDAAQSHRLEALLTVAITTGMRRGELLALRWEDIHFETKSLQVKHTVSYINPDGRYMFIETEPKTASGTRNIMLPTFVIDLLKQHRTRQLESRLQAGEQWKERNLVFPNTLGNYIAIPHLRLLFKQLLARAGLPASIRFHDLRHSAATILLAMGVNPKIIQEILGHADIRITMNIYSHVLPSMQREVMDNMDTLFRENGL